MSAYQLCYRVYQGASLSLSLSPKYLPEQWGGDPLRRYLTPGRSGQVVTSEVSENPRERGDLRLCLFALVETGCHIFVELMCSSRLKMSSNGIIRVIVSGCRLNIIVP